MISKSLGLYLHIPFCVKKCQYCDFLSFSANEEMKESYIKQLISEIKVRSALHQGMVDTIFLGGGTPSVLKEEQIERILKAVHQYFKVDSSAEITMEMNPNTVTAEKLRVCKEYGINRISFGVQSFDDKYLKLLGRLHSAKDVYENYEMARKVGFSNINLDLMSALPGQTLLDIKKELQEVKRLSPEHISFYGLIIEEGTPFFEKYEAQELRREAGEEQAEDELPDESAEREMYQCISESLKAQGYIHYEISNYGKEGLECQHNLKYWSRQDYLGLGLGAASLLEEKRYTNVRDIKEYLQTDFSRHPQGMIGETEVLDRKSAMEEFMFLGLRKLQGISTVDFMECFQQSYENVYRTVHQKLVSQGLICKEGEYVKLTPKGIDVSNYVMSEYLL